jgi:outer membrane protein OmpA-like peptidoglycan-associated protein
LAKKDEKLQTLTTDAQGKIAPFPIKTQSNYVFNVNAGEDFFHKEEEYSTFGKAIPHELLTKSVTDTTFYTKIILEKIAITDETYELEINFDFNKANIRPESAKELDKFVIFLKENPQIAIELGSHTDAVGSDRDNLALSQRRADSTVAYLVKNGIDASRMTAVGYGEKRLKINTQQAEIRNRRTEFKVTRIIRKRKED